MKTAVVVLCDFRHAFLCGKEFDKRVTVLLYLQIHEEQALALQLSSELIYASARDQFSLYEDADSVAYLLDLVQLM